MRKILATFLLVISHTSMYVAGKNCSKFMVLFSLVFVIAAISIIDDE